MAGDGQHLEPFVSALKRMGGMYGGVWVGGVLQTDAVSLIATIQRQRQTIALVGNQSEGYKPTRVSRSATLQVQKIDTRWELFVFNQLSQSIDVRRWWRDHPNGNPANAPGGQSQPATNFSVKLSIDDPDAFGYEAWQLDGCQLWDFRLGSGQTEEHIEPSYTMTWERETPIATFTVTPGQVTSAELTPSPVVVYTNGGPPS